MRYGWLLATPLLSALRLSPASPRRSAVLSMADSATPQFFGRDPRDSPLSEEKLAQLAEACKPVTGSSASTSDSVTTVLTLDDFEAALAASASRGRLTIFKFYAPWCRTCASIKKNYEAMAGGVMPKTMRYQMRAASTFAEVADFHEIEYSAARPLCAMCNITSMPLVHVYGPSGDSTDRYQLQLTSKLAKSSFISFCNRLAESADSLLLPAASAAEGRGGAATMAMPEGTRDLDPNLDRDLDAVIAPPT